MSSNLVGSASFQRLSAALVACTDVPPNYSGTSKRAYPLRSSSRPMRRATSEIDALATCIAAVPAAARASTITIASRVSRRVTRSFSAVISASSFSIALPCFASRVSSRSTLRRRLTKSPTPNALLDVEAGEDAVDPPLGFGQAIIERIDEGPGFILNLIMMRLKPPEIIRGGFCNIRSCRRIGRHWHPVRHFEQLLN